MNKMQTIELTQGKVTIVDGWNFEWLNQFRWYALLSRGRWYAVRSVRGSNGKRGLSYMHRAIMGVTDSTIEVDHKDRNATLDNREGNLRFATHAQNIMNQGIRTNNTSGFKGVSWYKRRHKWRAQIRSKYLGCFADAADAARAYNEAALKHYGEFAVLNDLSNVSK